MARNGSGAYSLPAGNPVVTGAVISSAVQNTTMSDVAAALTQSVSNDGQTQIVANLPMSGFRHTGVAAASARTDYAQSAQVQDSSMHWLTAVAGTDTITASLATPSLAAYAAGQVFRFISAGANTTTSVTLNINGIGAKPITKNGAIPLAIGDIQSGKSVEVIYDGTQFQVVGLATTASGRIQPISASVGSSALTISASALSLDFRSTALGSGAVTTVTGTPANLVISSGSTLGTVNAVQSRIVVLALNNAGTIELAAVNISGGNDLTETGLISTTAEGGAGAADSANVIYSTTARSNVAYRVIGYIESTQATAGTWATAPSTIQGCGGQALAAMSSLGYGQTWVNNGAGITRVPNVTYYNTTGKPIAVHITAAATNATTAVLALALDGGSPQVLQYTGAGVGDRAGIFFIVAAGGSYNYSDSSGGIQTQPVWRELR